MHRHWDGAVPADDTKSQTNCNLCSRGGENNSKALTAPSGDQVRPEKNKHSRRSGPSTPKCHSFRRQCAELSICYWVLGSWPILKYGWQLVVEIISMIWRGLC